MTHIITGLGVGGTEMTLHRLLSRSKGGELEADVVSLTTDLPIGERVRELGIPVQALHMRLRPRDTFAFAKLVRWIKRTRPDVVQTWMYHANALGGLAAKATGDVPVVWGIHAAGGNFEGYRTDTLMTVKGLAWLSRVVPDAIVFCAETSKQAHRGLGYKCDMMPVIPNGFDTTVYKPSKEARTKLRRELGVAPDTRLIGYVARFHPQKNHRDFVTAASLLLSQVDDVHIVLCGSRISWENGVLAKWIRDRGIEKRTHLLGQRDDTPVVAAGLDIATSSSSSEAFPNSIGEAMACGVPCVVTDAGDSAYLVGDTGRVVPVRNPEALAAAWAEMLNLDESGRGELGAAARARIAHHFEIGVIAERYARLYNEVLGR